MKKFILLLTISMCTLLMFSQNRVAYFSFDNDTIVNEDLTGLDPVYDTGDSVAFVSEGAPFGPALWVDHLGYLRIPLNILPANDSTFTVKWDYYQISTKTDGGLAWYTAFYAIREKDSGTDGKMWANGYQNNNSNSFFGTSVNWTKEVHTNYQGPTHNAQQGNWREHVLVFQDTMLYWFIDGDTVYSMEFEGNWKEWDWSTADIMLGARYQEGNYTVLDGVDHYLGTPSDNTHPGSSRAIIDEVMVYSDALSGEQIAEMYAARVISFDVLNIETAVETGKSTALAYNYVNSDVSYAIVADSTVGETASLSGNMLTATSAGDVIVSVFANADPRVKDELTISFVEDPNAFDTVFYYTFDGTLENMAGTAPAITNTSGLTGFYNMDADGVNGKALMLDGSLGSFLSIEQTDLLNPSAEPFTVAAWVYNTSDVEHPMEHVILHQTNKLNISGTGSTRFYLSFKGDGASPSENLRVGNFLAAGDYRSKDMVYRDSWVHIACTGDPLTGEMKFFINGEESVVQKWQGGNSITDPDVQSVPFENATHPFIIGKHHGKDDATWKGMIDDLVMFKKALTAEQIQQVAGIVPTYYAQVDDIVTTSAQAGMNPENLVNYSGIDAVGFDLVHDWDYGKMFASAAQVRSMNIFMSLADTINLYSMELFNHSHFWPEGAGGAGAYFTNRGMKDFKVYYAATDNNRMDTVALDNALWTEVGAFELGRALDQQWNKGEKFMLGDIEANWIVIEGLTNHGGNKIGLNEIILWSREETPILAKSIDVSLESDVAYEGEMVKAMLSVSPVNNNEALTWEIVDATAGTSIDADGMITVGAPGTVKVVAVGELASDTAELTISAPKVAIDASEFIIYMPFDSTYEDVANGHEFTLATGDTAFTENGKFGSAAVMDTTHLASVEDSLFSTHEPISIAAWIYHDSLASVIGHGYTWLHQMNVSGQDAGRIHLEVLGGTDAIGTFSGGVRNDNTTPIETETWYHVASVVDTISAKHYLYINGLLVATADMKEPAEVNWGRLVIGGRKNFVEIHSAIGLIDELLITKEVLTQDQVLAVMNLGVEKASTGYVPVQSISVDAPESVASGDSIMATVTIVERSNTDFGGAVWMLDGDTTNSMITQSGKLYGGDKAGTVTVVAKAADGSGVMGSADVVVYIPVSSIVVSAEGDATSVAVGGTLQMMAMVSPEDAEDNTVTWEVVGATAGTSIDENGLLTAGETGTVTVKATANDGSGVTGELEISIEKPVMVLLDFMNNQIASSVNDPSLKTGGDIWIRDNTGDLTTIDIISTEDAPAGYDLTDSVLQIVVDASFTKYFEGLMVETFDTLTVDTVNFRYLHIAYYIPVKSTKSGGVMKSWLKDTAAVGNYNTNHIGNKGFEPETMNWVDMVLDITNDSIHGTTLSHFELYGFSIGDTSYVGSVVLSGDSLPRFENAVAVNAINLSAPLGSGDSVRETLTIQINAEVLPAGADNKAVAWEIVNATAGTTISAEGVLTAGDPGTVTVKATAEDGSGVSATIDILIFDKNTAINNNRVGMLKIYPNPSNGMFTVSLPGIDNAMFKVFDTTGRQITSGTLNSGLTLDLSSQKSGIYFLEVFINNTRTVNKLIVK